jgi:hypothetical protein
MGMSLSCAARGLNPTRLSGVPYGPLVTRTGMRERLRGVTS